MTVTPNLERSSSPSQDQYKSFDSVDSRTSNLSERLSDSDSECLEHRELNRQVSVIETVVRVETGISQHHTQVRPRNWGCLFCIIVGYFLGSGIFISGFSLAVVCENTCEESLKKAPGIMMALGTILFIVTFVTHQFKGCYEEIFADSH